jgi:hypothetical protein
MRVTRETDRDDAAEAFSSRGRSRTGPPFRRTSAHGDVHATVCHIATISRRRNGACFGSRAIRLSARRGGPASSRASARRPTVYSCQAACRRRLPIGEQLHSQRKREAIGAIHFLRNRSCNRRRPAALCARGLYALHRRQCSVQSGHGDNRWRRIGDRSGPDSTPRTSFSITVKVRCCCRRSSGF